MKRKTCKDCGRRRTLTMFYAHTMMADGHLNSCKDCHKAAVRARHARDPEKRRQYDRERGRDPKRIEATTARKRAWARKNPERRRAHSAVAYAVRTGKLERPATCSACGGGGRIHAHHDDYSKPLDVRWMCAACHAQHHS